MGKERDIKQKIENLLQVGELVEAYHIIRAAVKEAPWKKELVYLYAFVSICNGYEDEAETALENEADFGSNDDFILAKAYLLMKKDQNEEAAALISKIVNIHKSSIEILNSYGVKIFSLGLLELGYAYLYCVLSNPAVTKSDKFGIKIAFEYELSEIKDPLKKYTPGLN